MPACHVNILCGRLACFKKGLNGFATLAVGLEQLAELGGEASETPPEVSLRNATPASLINYLPSASPIYLSLSYCLVTISLFPKIET